MFHALMLVCMGTMLFGIEMIRHDVYPVFGGIVIGVGVMMLIAVLHMYWARHLKRGRRKK